ncbi:MAG: twin-arginine translocation pathway signal protein [Verrucomicrobia bacterium]|nr:twin-arginine translocation pathway signal protein [Verrucomicrobiota bacterium]
MSPNASRPRFPTTRREFLQLTGRGIGLLAFSRFAPAFLINAARASTPAPETGRPILVLIQLAGGNDGLNTLVPFEDPNYFRLRRTLAMAKDQVIRLSGTAGLHPSCAELGALFHDGKLAIVQNVGYPNPNRSHFRSSEIWETASGSSEFLANGWIGRYLDNACAGAPRDSHDPMAVHLGSSVPQSFLGAHEHPTFGLGAGSGNRRENEENRRLLESLCQSPGAADDNASFLRHTLLDSLVTEKRVQRVIGDYRPALSYPTNAFGTSLRNVAALIADGLPTRVYFVPLSGFDTHSNQANQQANLLATLSQGLAAFQRDLASHHLDDQVVTMTFSEFGRRPSENESRGTDHGTAAPLFVMGSRVKGGLHGTAPSLDLARNEDLAFTTDFRDVYATMLDRWLGCPSTAVLGEKFSPLPIV